MDWRLRVLGWLALATLLLVAWVPEEPWSAKSVCLGLAWIYCLLRAVEVVVGREEGH